MSCLASMIAYQRPSLLIKRPCRWMGWWVGSCTLIHIHALIHANTCLYMPTHANIVFTHTNTYQQHMASSRIHTPSPIMVYFLFPTHLHIFPTQNLAEDWTLGSKGCYDAVSLTRLQAVLKYDVQAVAVGNVKGCVSIPLGVSAEQVWCGWVQCDFIIGCSVV